MENDQESNIETEASEEIFAEPEEYNDWNYIIGLIINPITAWSTLFIVILLVCFWNRIQDYLDTLYVKWQQREYEEKCHKNPDWVMSNFERMEQARRKLQEQYNVEAVEHQIKTSEKERQKNLEKLMKCSTVEGGHRLNETSPQNRPAYSPLDGDGSGRYRPQKRSKCAGGGCG